MKALIQLTDPQAALFWNAAVITALILMLIIQWREIKRLGLEPLTAFVAIATFNAALLIGARLGALDLTDYRTLFSEGWPDHESGRSIFGGLLLALPLFWWLKRYLKLGAAHADALFVALPLGAAIIKVGCSAAGCCFGTISNSSLAWSYGAGMPAYDWQWSEGLIPESAAASLPVFPVQSMITLSGLLIFALLWTIRKKMKVAGSMAFLSIGLVFINRFGWEFLREAITDRGALGEFYGGLKIVQWVSLTLGVTAVILYWFNERRAARTYHSGEPSFARTSLLLLITVSAALVFRSVLSLEEQAVLWISAVPALSILLRELWLRHVFQQRLATTVFSSLSGLLMTFTVVDTIPAMQKGDQWITIGSGYTHGSYVEIHRDCDGNIVGREHIQLKSTGFDLAYYNQFSNKGSIGIGVHGSIGQLSSDDVQSYNNYRFSAIGPYLDLNLPGIGLGYGRLFTGQWNDQENITPRPYDRNYTATAYLRLGKVHSYYFAVRYLDYAGVNYYPQPSATLGIFNWGFNDYTGNTSISMGLAGVNDETAFFMSGKVPLGHTGLRVDGAFYLQDQAMFSLGMKYRWVLPRRNRVAMY
jgi:prolipoprotein diacylglyceryltransferase